MPYHRIVMTVWVWIKKIYALRLIDAYFKNYFYIFILEKPSWRSGTACDCKRYICGLDLHLGECLYLIYFNFTTLAYEKTRWVLPLDTQYLKNWAESEEQSVFIQFPPSLCFAGKSVKLYWFVDQTSINTYIK